MSVPMVTLPDSLYRRLEELAAKEQVTIDQFVASAVAEKMSIIEKEGYLTQRAQRADEQEFQEALSKISDSVPEQQDKL